VVFRKKKEDGKIEEISMKAAANQLKFSYKDRNVEKALAKGEKMISKNYEYSITYADLDGDSKALAKSDAVVPEVVETMTEAEQKRLEKWEAQVARSDMTMFEAAMRRGKALHAIKESKLYKKLREGSDIPAFKTFPEYVKYQYNRGRSMGRNYISLYKVAEALKSQGVEPKLLGTMNNGIEMFEGVNKLVRAHEIGNDEVDEVTRKLVKLGWRLMSRSVPTDEEGKPDLSPENIHVVFETLGSVAKTGSVEHDGEQIPVSLAETVFDDNVTDAIYEQMMKRRDKVMDDKKKTKQRKKSTKDAFIVNKKEDDDVIIPLNCPEHGETQPNAIILAGYSMTCGCNAVFKSLEDGSNVFVVA